MIIYLLTILYTYFASYLYTKVTVRRNIIGSNENLIKRKRSFLLYIISILPAIVVSGIRYGIGVDYIKVYDRSYHLIANGSYDNQIIQFEWGFKQLCRILSLFFKESSGMFFVTSAIIILLFFKAFKINSKSYLMSILIFFFGGVYFDSFNGIRQYIAIGIFLIAIKYVEEGKFWKYTILIAFATFFHTSCIILIPAYFLSKVEIKKEIAIGLAFIAFLIQSRLLNLLMTIMAFVPKYNEYLVRNTLGNQVSFSTSGLVLSIIAFVVLLAVEKKMKESSYGKFLYNMAILGVVIALISGFLPFADRLLYYTKSLYIISIPYAGFCVKNRRNAQVLTTVFIAVSGIMNLLGMIFNDWYAILPYVTIFSK